MQKRTWRQAAGAVVLCVVPALALAWFTPAALSSLNAARPGPRDLALRTTGQNSEVAAPANVLEVFTETQSGSPTATQLSKFLVDFVHSESTNLGNKAKAYRTQLGTLTPGTNQYQIIFQFLQLTLAQQNGFNANWKKNGGAGSSANLSGLFQGIQTLNVAFAMSDTNLNISQTTQMQKGASITGFTPPTF